MIGYLVAIFCLNGFGNLITHLKFFQNQLVNSVAIGYFNLVVMLIQLIKGYSPSAITCVQCSFGYTVVGDQFDIIVKHVSGEWEIRRVPRIGRTFAVNENTFSCFSIENEECIGHAILFYMKVSFVLGNEIIVIEQVL